MAELAGISYSTLSRIENGLRALDRHSEMVVLAEALEIAPSELTRLATPAPTNGNVDSATDAVRMALMAVDQRLPGGRALPVDALRTRVSALVAAQGRCDRSGDLGVRLPTNTPESMQVAGTLALCRSLLATVDSRPADVEAPFREASPATPH